MLIKAVNNQYVDYVGEDAVELNDGEKVSFPLIQQQFGKYIRVSDDGTIIKISLPGTYIIHYNANVMNNMSNNKVAISKLQSDGKDVLGASAMATVGESEFENISFTTTITIPCSCCDEHYKELTIVNAGNPMTYQSRNIVVERVNKRI